MIYVLQPEPGGPVKIGFSGVETASDVWRRVAALEPGCPWPLKLVATMRGTRYDEGLLHERFADLRIHREWFRLEGELALWLRGLAGEQLGPPMPSIEQKVVSLEERRARSAGGSR